MWSNQYIGIPYKAGGRDRSGLDCWGLARLIYEEQYKINLPSFSAEYTEDDTERMEELIDQYREGWSQLEAPEPGSLVLLRVLGSESHIGIVLEDNNFIHIREGSDSCVESLVSGRWSNRIAGYYKYSPQKGALVNALPHPLKTERITLPIPSGINVSTLILWISKEYDVPVELLPNIVILINSMPVHKADWDTTFINNGDAVEYRVVAGKDVVRTVALIALAVYAPVLAGSLTGYTAAASAATLLGASVTTGLIVANAVVTAGIVLAGSALINAIAPIRPPTVTTPTDPGQAERMYMIDGMQNPTRLYEGIPVILGKVRMTPPLGANNFINYLSERDQYISSLLVWGYGPLVIDQSTLRIGDAAWSTFSDKQIVTLDRITEPTAAQKAAFDALYGRDVEQKIRNITLTAVGPNETSQPAPAVDYTGDNLVATAFDTPGADNLTVAMHFPEGLRRVNKQDGNSSETAVKFFVQISVDGGINWSSASPPAANRGVPSPSSGIYNVAPGSPKKDAFTVTFDIAIITPITSSIAVRVRRETSSTKEDSSYAYYYTSILQSVQKTINTAPTVDPVGVKVAKSALQIKATGQLSGQLEGISAVVQTYARIFSGGTWTSYAGTNNPAALFLYIITHPGNAQRVTTAEEADKIDFTQLGYWYNYCVTKGFQFNSVVGAQRSVLEILRDICAAGRASPAIINGKWTVTIDEPKPYVIQHFSPHNSWGFESTKLLPKIPDGIKVQFFDEDLDYQENEVVIYNNGKSYQTATVFESISLPGVTKKSLAIDHARWQLSQAKARPEVYTINTDLEYLVCTRGDRVKLTHDIPMWGMGSGRVRNKEVTSGIWLVDLDEPISIEDPNAQHMLRFRTNTTPVTDLTSTIVQTWSVSTVGRTNNVARLDLGFAHPFKVGDKVTVNINATGYSSFNATNATITQVSADEIYYSNPGTNVNTVGIGGAGTAKLVASNYTRVQLQSNASTVGSSIAAGDLFLFGISNKESQDLIVLSIEPTSNKTAKLTLVDYGVTDQYNLFTDYVSIVEGYRFDRGYTGYSVTNGIVTLYLRSGHGVLAGSQVTVGTAYTGPYAGNNYTGVYYDTPQVINATVISSTTNAITYAKPGQANTGGIVTLNEAYTQAYFTVIGGFVFESQISDLPYNYRNSLTDQTPVINSIVSDESVIETIGPGAFILKMVVSIAPAADNRQLPLDVQFAELEYDYVNAAFSSGSRIVRTTVVEGIFSLRDVDEGAQYKMRVRYIMTNGKVGSWSQWYTHIVIGKTTVPASVTNLTVEASTTSTNLTLKWTPNTEKDIFGYEIRTSNASWGASGYLWRGQATQATIPMSSIPGLTTTFFIKAIDYNKNYSINATSTTVNRSRPLAPSNLQYAYGTTTTSAYNVLDISWTAATVPTNGLAVKHYLVSITKPLGSGTTIPQFVVAGTTTSIVADWVGNATISVTTVDILEQTSLTAATASVGKVAPLPLIDPYAAVVDNNVLLYWTLPAKTSMPITAVNVRKGPTFATSQFIGSKSGGFTSLFELAAGTYTYWLTTVDSDNRESSAVPVTVTVSQPPDYVFNDLLISDFITNATKVNCSTIVSNTGNAVLMLVNSTENWNQHFTSNSVDQIQDFINAGYQYYVQPASGIVSASFTQIFDLGTVLASSSVTVSYLKELIVGNPNIVVQIATGTGTNINNITWSPLAASSSFFATNFKYIKVVITAEETAAADLVLIRDLTVRLDSKLKNDAGYITANASDTQGTIVNFNTNNVFVDITSITVTPNSTTPLVAVYDFKDSTLNGTYSYINGIVTVNVTDHGLITGQRVRLAFVTGGLTSGVFAITKVDNNTYTVNMPGVVGGTGGNVSTYPQSMRIYVYDLNGVQQNCPQVSWAVKGY